MVARRGPGTRGEQPRRGVGAGGDEGPATGRGGGEAQLRARGIWPASGASRAPVPPPAILPSCVTPLAPAARRRSPSRGGPPTGARRHGLPSKRRARGACLGDTRGCGAQNPGYPFNRAVKTKTRSSGRRSREQSPGPITFHVLVPSRRAVSPPPPYFLTEHNTLVKLYCAPGAIGALFFCESTPLGPVLLPISGLSTEDGPALLRGRTNSAPLRPGPASSTLCHAPGSSRPQIPHTGRVGVFNRARWPSFRGKGWANRETTRKASRTSECSTSGRRRGTPRSR